MKAKAPGVDYDLADLVSALKVISGKWKVRIICLLFGGTKRFGELRRSLAGIDRGTLTYELRGLEAKGTQAVPFSRPHPGCRTGFAAVP
jgi:DNA-binding HxlR family transcriptional regulator